MTVAQARKVDIILVAELTRWGRSMLDLFHTLQDLQPWDVLWRAIIRTGSRKRLRVSDP